MNILYKLVYVLRATFDDSDIMTDYFNRDRSLDEWFVAQFEGTRVTESKLRRALQQLPSWLREYDWTFQKGEKYSMSDVYYGQLRVDKGVGLTVKNSWNRESSLGFILTVTSLRVFEMNRKIDIPIPQSIDEIKELIERKQRESEECRAEAKKRMEESRAKIEAQAHAVIDEKGFRILKRG